METTLSKEEVRRVANLAKIRLTEEEVTSFSADLGRILQVAQSLLAVDTSQVQPTTSVSGVTMPLRDDVVTERDNAKQVLANARHEYDYFVVPKVIE
jgi:aspartyl-tRNA(Asn)/glutamyl-tRNA(Gln) amidotransferase subunit C